ncbi:hypothetical protein ACWCXX_20245 [Streptomyces sp. NPDC001732]
MARQHPVAGPLLSFRPASSDHARLAEAVRGGQAVAAQQAEVDVLDEHSAGVPGQGLNDFPLGEPDLLRLHHSSVACRLEQIAKTLGIWVSNSPNPWTRPRPSRPHRMAAARRPPERLKRPKRLKRL